MELEEWEKTVPATMTGDALWRVQAYRLALHAYECAWDDITTLAKEKRTRAVADQLYRALGSISANIAEGYSRGFGRERAHSYEYALGSAREARDWYYKVRRVLAPSWSRSASGFSPRSSASCSPRSPASAAGPPRSQPAPTIPHRRPARTPTRGTTARERCRLSARSRISSRITFTHHSRHASPHVSPPLIIPTLARRGGIP